VQDHRLLRLHQDAVVDALVVGRARRDAREGAAGHDDQPAAERFDRCHLLFVGADDVVDRRRCVEVEVVGAAAGGDERAGMVAGGVERAADQLERGRPVEAHAALRRVHRLGDAEAERPEALPVGDRRVPVERGGDPRIACASGSATTCAAE
jgi:hypothetical protein